SLIPRLYEIQDGTLLVDGVDIREYTLADIRSQIALASQDIFLFDDTVAVNIAYGNIENATDEKIREAAKSAYALDFIENLPNGFDTEIGERGVRLSGGQKQRIAIARAFIKDAPILIFDEATSSLDTKSEFEVRKALDALGEGRTVIIVAHRLASIEHVERIVVLSEGRIVEDGTHQELLAREGHYYQLYTVYKETEEQN
ncbi:MAG: ATP-binding cassette domain-containing protein, partial [Gammaproteobacteria bacterium]|nr:ATP-binding cassette domain-containing protein [Gammaproteobacteria bacterium]